MIILIFALNLIGGAGHALTYEMNFGLGTTDATSTRGDVAQQTNGRFGLGIDVNLSTHWSVATGTDYVFRRVTWHRGDGARVRVDFDFIDVPVLARVTLAGPIALVYGLRFGVNVSDKVEVQRGTPTFDPVARAIITLFEVGLRARFSESIAGDAFFEREVGDGFAADLGDLSTLGGRINYLF